MQLQGTRQKKNNFLKVHTANLENHDCPPSLWKFTEVFKNEHDIIQLVGSQRQTHPNVT